MPNGFEPQTAFEGYIVATLEGMKERLNALPCDEQSKRVGKCENDIANIKGKATMLGGVAGFVTYLLSKIFMNK